MKRKAVAMTKMDKELRLFVSGELDKCLNGSTFEDIVHILRKEFHGPGNVADAFRELGQLEYSFEDPPRRFVQQFKANFGAVCKEYPHVTPPNVEKMWKKAILRNVPYEVRDRLDLFKDYGMEETFLSELERERGYRKRVNVAKVENGQEEREVRPPVVKAAVTPNREMHYRRQPTNFEMTPRHCGWCTNGSFHERLECPRKPPRYSCFDCLQVGVKKGHEGCPGRINVRYPQQTRPTRTVSVSSSSSSSGTQTPRE